jgi:hypothetical protein
VAHKALPGIAPYVPLAHERHWALDTAAIVLRYCPEVQLVHSAVPVRDAYEPVGHFMHDVIDVFPLID